MRHFLIKTDIFYLTRTVASCSPSLSSQILKTFNCINIRKHVLVNKSVLVFSFHCQLPRTYMWEEHTLKCSAFCPWSQQPPFLPCSVCLTSVAHHTLAQLASARTHEGDAAEEAFLACQDMGQAIALSQSMTDSQTKQFMKYTGGVLLWHLLIWVSPYNLLSKGRWRTDNHSQSYSK